MVDRPGVASLGGLWTGGAGDFACYFDVVRIKLLEWSPVLHALAALLTDLFNAAIEAIKPHLQSLIALGSLSFAIWKWVRYREGALFRRLKDLIAKTISGLRIGRSDLLGIRVQAVARSECDRSAFHRGATSTGSLAAQLVAHLKQRSHHEYRPATDRALKEIDKQLQWTEMHLALFREQRATVHLIKGAIASARSDRSTTAKGW